MNRTTRRLPFLPTLAAVLVLALAGDALAAGDGGLVLVPDLKMLLALVLFFALLVFPVNALLFRPIFATLDARDERIAGTVARAEKLAADAEETLERYERSVREVKEQADEGRKTVLAAARDSFQEQSQAARAAAEAELERARREIAGELESARGGLRGQAEALASAAAASVLGRGLS